MGSRDHVQTVKELKLFANTAIENGVKIPLHILEILEDVIDDRTRVHDFFKKQANPNDQDATSSHAYFTDVLLEIHGDLKALIDVPLKSPKPQAKALPLPFNNIFDRLSLEECTANQEKLLPTGCECKTNSGVKRKNVPSTNSEEIEEDAIGHYVAISIFLSVSLMMVNHDLC